MSWIAPDATTFARVFDLVPELHARFREFAELFPGRRPVDPAVLALCRVRVAQLLGVVPEAGELPPETVAALEDWRAAPAFCDVERACLAFTEKFVRDPHGVTDADAAAVAAHLSPPALVAFAEALALFDGFTRFRAILGVV